MSKETELLKDYLGDGVYAIYDGLGIWLHANDHKNLTDKIYLEPNVLTALNVFAKRCTELGSTSDQKEKP